MNFDENGYVANWARVPCDVEDSIEYDGDLPDDFAEFCNAYRYENGFVIDEKKKREIEKARENE